MARLNLALTLLVLVLVLGAMARAETLYRWTMPDGGVLFSDRPEEAGAVSGEEVVVTPTGGLAPPAASAENARETRTVPGQSEADADEGYTSFAIVAPRDDDNIRQNTGSVVVRFALEPELRDGHVIEVFLNGRSIGSGRQRSVTLSNLDRGVHEVEARVRGRGGEQLAATRSVTFNLQRTSKNQPARKRNFGS